MKSGWFYPCLLAAASAVCGAQSAPLATQNSAQSSSPQGSSTQSSSPQGSVAQSHELPSAPSELVHPPAPAPVPKQSPAAQPQTQQVPVTDPAGIVLPPDSVTEAEQKKQGATPVGQQPAGNPADYTFVKPVDEVNVVFTVTDKHGRFIRNLKKEDFNVLDDKKPAIAIRSFRAETDLPLRVGLLIDASNSIRDRFKFEQDSAIEFLNQIIRPRADLAFVIGFDSSPEVTQDFTSSTERLSNGVRMLRPGGGTALFDALFYACRDKLQKYKDNSPSRRAIILLSDGDDNQSRVTREEAIEMAQRAEVIIYAISTNLAPNADRGDKVLERIADATGGRAFFPFKIQDVANAFVEIKDELRSQYSIAYKPSDFSADGRYRSIDIDVPAKKYRVRARKGYYAPKQANAKVSNVPPGK